ncbi:PEP-CTERM sorting domain-containing protein [Methylobacillus sp.]|uniref:PEP-CTERM sorting domain-containing protein n=1 Tax=Methylobacillus sp. TaxID=56818 RepID=UPI002FE2133A
MNVKMKALIAAAVAAISVSGAANAALTTGATGSSSLVLAVWDVTNKISTVFDLGIDYAGFAFGSAGSSASMSWDMSAGDYADTWNAIFGNPALGTDVRWGVVATDYNGSINVAGSMGFISTTKEGQKLPANLAMGQFGAPMAQFDKYLVDNNAKGNVADAGNGYAGTFFTAYKLFNFGPIVLDQLGKEQEVVQYFSAAGSRPGSYMAYVEYDATFKLDANGLLTYTVAAVPEPETYALLLAGLGLVGFAARRRKSA